MRFIIHPTNTGTSRCVRCGIRKDPHDGETMCQHCLGIHDYRQNRPFRESAWFVRP